VQRGVDLDKEEGIEREGNGKGVKGEWEWEGEKEGVEMKMKDAVRVLEKHIQDRMPFAQVASRRMQAAMGVRNEIVFGSSLSLIWIWFCFSLVSCTEMWWLNFDEWIEGKEGLFADVCRFT
jgi:hypothetical protein